MDTARVIELYAPAADGDGGQVGSGYRVAPEVVLTAAHVVAGLPLWPRGEPVPAATDAPGACWARPSTEREWVPAVVGWRDQDRDVAVLRLGSAAPPLPVGSAAPRWGRIDGFDPVDVLAVGFPWAQERVDHSRDTEQLIGFIAPAAMAKAHLYAVTVRTSEPSARDGGSPWAGMSGAAVFAGSFLVGVVVVDPARFGPDRLVAAPVGSLLSDPDLAGLVETTMDDVAGVRGQLPLAGRDGAGTAPVDTLLRPPALVGRAGELRQLRAAVQEAAGGRPVTILAVYGMGGAGKTALARQLATEVASGFPDARVEIDLYGFTPERPPRDPGGVLDELLRLVGFAAGDIPGTTEGRSQMWRSYLSTRRALLLLDNARSAEQVSSLLPGGAGSGRCLVVVTSRNALDDLDATATLALGTLRPDDAVDLLIGVSHRDVEDLADARGQLETLARLCGWLPLALRPVGSLLARVEPGDLVEAMRSTPNPLEDLPQADQAAGAAFTVSYEALDEALQRTVRACAWHPGPDFDADSVAALIDKPRHLIAIQLAELAASNVLTALSEGRYGFHDLFLVYAQRAVASHDEPAAVDAACRRLGARLFDRLEAAASLIHPDNRRVRGRTIDPAGFTGRDQARAWFTAAADELATTADAALDGGWADSDRFAEALAYWLYADGRSDQPRKLYEALHKAACESRNRAGEAAAVAGRGLIAYVRGDYQAAQVAFREACELSRQTGDRQGEADVVKSLADIDRVRGDDDEAEAGYRHARELYAATQDQRGEADALKGLGDVAYTRGRSQEARDCYERALDLCRLIGYRSGQADALCGLGDVALRDNEARLAQEVFEQARDIFVDIGNVHGLAYALKGLGDAARHQGDHQKAEESYGRARDLYERIGFRNCLADVLIGLGAVAGAKGDDRGAEALYRQASDISQQIGYRDGETAALESLEALPHP